MEIKIEQEQEQEQRQALKRKVSQRQKGFDIAYKKGRFNSLDMDTMLLNPLSIEPETLSTTSFDPPQSVTILLQSSRISPKEKQTNKKLNRIQL